MAQLSGAMKIATLILMIGSTMLFMLVPGARIHWSQILAGYGLAALLFVWEPSRAGSGASPSLWNYLFPKDVWLHRSSLNDAIFAFMIFGLMISLFNQWIFTPFYYVELAKSLGSLLPIDVTVREAAVPGVPMLVLYTFTSLVFAEFFWYWAHRMAHTIPVLWEFHKVHHSAQVMTPITVYRMHPIEFWLTSSAKAFGYGLNLVIFSYFFPGLDNVLRLLGANAVVFVLGLAGGVLHHSHIWLSFGPIIERLLISPAQHQIHHSGKPEHYNKNYGAVLSIWDWLFGSLYTTAWKREDFTFGLGGAEEEAPYQTLRGMLFFPFKGIFRLATRRLEQAGNNRG